MNKREFLSALGQALSGLPEEERRSVLQYYEDYFLDAEGEGDAQIIEGLGQPHNIADDILREYRELQPHPGKAAGEGSAPRPPRWKGINPWLLAALVLLAIPIGVPLAAGLFGLIAGLAAAAVAIVLSAFLLVFLLPAVLLITGVALLGASFVQWGMPASAVMTIGIGLACLSLGGLSAILLVKLCKLFIPPIIHGLVAFVRWLIDKLRGVLR